MGTLLAVIAAFAQPSESIKWNGWTNLLASGDPILKGPNPVMVNST